MTTIVADGLRPGIRDFGARMLAAATASHARVIGFQLAMSLVCFIATATIMLNAMIAAASRVYNPMITATGAITSPMYTPYAMNFGR